MGFLRPFPTLTPRYDESSHVCILHQSSVNFCLHAGGDFSEAIITVPYLGHFFKRPGTGLGATGACN